MSIKLSDEAIHASIQAAKDWNRDWKCQYNWYCCEKDPDFESCQITTDSEYG